VTEVAYPPTYLVTIIMFVKATNELSVFMMCFKASVHFFPFICSNSVPQTSGYWEVTYIFVHLFGHREQSKPFAFNFVSEKCPCT